MKHHRTIFLDASPPRYLLDDIISDRPTAVFDCGSVENVIGTVAVRGAERGLDHGLFLHLRSPQSAPQSRAGQGRAGQGKARRLLAARTLLLPLSDRLTTSGSTYVVSLAPSSLPNQRRLLYRSASSTPKGQRAPLHFSSSVRIYRRELIELSWSTQPPQLSALHRLRSTHSPPRPDYYITGVSDDQNPQYPAQWQTSFPVRQSRHLALNQGQSIVANSSASALPHSLCHLLLTTSAAANSTSILSHPSTRMDVLSLTALSNLGRF